MLPDLHTLMQNSRFVQNHSWKSQDINQRYSWTGQLHTSGCQEAELPPDLAPPPLFYPTHHWTLTLRSPPSSPHPQDLPLPPSTYKLWPAPVTLCSIGLITTSSSIDCTLPLSDSLIKDWFNSLSSCHFNRLISSFCTTHYICSFVYLTGLHSICHVPYATLSISFFLQCPHLYICIVCMYICLNCIYLYLYVYCQCLMLTVCTKGLRVTQFQFSVCMYCTCGRIDNKQTWIDLMNSPWNKRQMLPQL